MRTIAELLNLDGRVYVYVPSKNIRRLFLKNAQKEGFMFADGVNPTKRRVYDDIYALNKDFTLNFVGYIGHIAFHHPSYFDNDKLIRIDYCAYLSGAENYIIKKRKPQTPINKGFVVFLYYSHSTVPGGLEVMS